MQKCGPPFYLQSQRTSSMTSTDSYSTTGSDNIINATTYNNDKKGDLEDVETSSYSNFLLNRNLVPHTWDIKSVILAIGFVSSFKKQKYQSKVLLTKNKKNPKQKTGVVVGLTASTVSLP